MNPETVITLPFMREENQLANHPTARSAVGRDFFLGRQFACRMKSDECVARLTHECRQLNTSLYTIDIASVSHGQRQGRIVTKNLTDQKSTR